MEELKIAKAELEAELLNAQRALTSQRKSKEKSLNIRAKSKHKPKLKSKALLPKKKNKLLT